MVLGYKASPSSYVFQPQELLRQSLPEGLEQEQGLPSTLSQHPSVALGTGLCSVLLPTWIMGTQPPVELAVSSTLYCPCPSAGGSGPHSAVWSTLLTFSLSSKVAPKVGQDQRRAACHTQVPGGMDKGPGRTDASPGWDSHQD